MTSQDHGRRLLMVASKHRGDIQMVESAIEHAPVQHRADLMLHLEWLKGGPQRTLSGRAWRWVMVFARPVCSIPGCGQVALFCASHFSRQYCRTHRAHVQVDNENTSKFYGYADRADDIAVRGRERDYDALSHGISRNSGITQRVRRR